MQPDSVVFVCFLAAESPRAGQRSWVLGLVVSFQVMEQVETEGLATWEEVQSSPRGNTGDVNGWAA